MWANILPLFWRTTEWAPVNQVTSAYDDKEPWVMLAKENTALMPGAQKHCRNSVTTVTVMITFVRALWFDRWSLVTAKVITAVITRMTLEMTLRAREGERWSSREEWRRVGHPQQVTESDYFHTNLCGGHISSDFTFCGEYFYSFKYYKLKLWPHFTSRTFKTTLCGTLGLNSLTILPIWITQNSRT